MLRPIKQTKNPKNFILKSIYCTLFFLSMTSPALAHFWQTLAPGIEYQDLITSPLTPWAHIHAFRISLKQNQLDLITAKRFPQKNATINELAKKSHALIAINGGFFDQNFHPLGLRIKHHQAYNPLKRISWWGVFYIKNQRPFITSSHEYEASPLIDFAVQSGPRLIIDGHIPHLKPGIAERSALGITRQNKVIILVTDKAMLTTTELAHLLRASPLSCINALNLDGGSSSQLVANLLTYHLDVHGFANLSDAIVVKSITKNPTKAK